eukprot:scaffold203012_cov19-Tisochrysis_lutea.AAC.1
MGSTTSIPGSSAKTTLTSAYCLALRRSILHPMNALNNTVDSLTLFPLCHCDQMLRHVLHDGL